MEEETVIDEETSQSGRVGHPTETDTSKGGHPTETDTSKSGHPTETDTSKGGHPTETDTSGGSGEDLLDKFEQQYQTEKVLNSSSGVQAEIVRAGWRDSPSERYVGAVCLGLSVPGGADYDVIISQHARSETGSDFVALLEWLEQSPQRDLSALEGETVAVDITASGGTEFVRFAASNTIVHGQIVDDDTLVRDADSELPAAVVSAFTRLARYRQQGGESIRIADLRATEDELILDLDGGWGEIRVPVERQYESTPQTPYERLVEDVGQGSVKQIEGGSIHLVHASDVPPYLLTPFSDLDDSEQERLYSGLVTTMTDSTGEWAIFLDEPRREVDLILAGGVVVSILLVLVGLFAGAPPAFFLAAMILYGTAKQAP